MAASLIDHFGWRVTYRILGALGGVALLGCAAVATRPPRPVAAATLADSGAEPSDGAGAVRDGRGLTKAQSRLFVQLYVSGLFLSLALFLVFIFLAPFAEEHGVRHVAAATLVGIVGAASVVGRLALGVVADRLGAVRAYRASFLCIALSYLLWLTTTTYHWLVAFAVVFGVAYGGFIALSPAVMAQLFGTATMGRLVGLLYTSAGIGALVGPPLAGLAVDRTGSYRWAIAVAMGLAVGGWAVLLPLRGPAPSSGPEPA
jgi:MFS family permease